MENNWVYFGSFHISAGILERLVAAGAMPRAVICSPDRPAGRDKKLTPPRIKQLIAERGWQIEVLQPESLAEVAAYLQRTKPALALVMGYPKILTAEILKLPTHGTIGIHPSLLPLYRGASPIQSVLLAGEEKTGVTLYQMDEKMDHGPIVAQAEIDISHAESNDSLIQKVITVARDLAAQVLPTALTGTVDAHPQNHAVATFTKKFSTADARCDMQNDAPLTIYRKIKALNPEPGAWTMNFPGREEVRVKLLDATYENGLLTITQIQPDGKKPMPCSVAISR